MEDNAVRNFKDFLLLYNQMTERCFTRCVDSVQTRKLNEDEQKCVDSCSAKFITYNNKLMQHFVKVQSAIVSKRIQDAEEQQKEIEQQQTSIPQGTSQIQQNSIEVAA